MIEHSSLSQFPHSDYAASPKLGQKESICRSSKQMFRTLRHPERPFDPSVKRYSWAKFWKSQEITEYPLDESRIPVDLLVLRVPFSESCLQQQVKSPGDVSNDQESILISWAWF